MREKESLETQRERDRESERKCGIRKNRELPNAAFYFVFLFFLLIQRYTLKSIVESLTYNPNFVLMH
jgi:hypothetical protein